MIESKIGKFQSVSDLIQALENNGYANLGWQNVWGKENYERLEKLQGERESFDYGLNNTTHLTIIHEAKIFYRCDSGD